MKKTLALFMATVMLLSSCYTTRTVVTPISSIMDTWLGHTEKEAINTFGPPTRITTDGGTGHIITFEKHGSVTLRTLAPPNSLVRLPDIYRTAETNNYIYFYVNDNDVIYKYSTNYPNTVSKVKEKNKTETTIAYSLLGAAAVIGVFVLLNMPTD